MASVLEEEEEDTQSNGITELHDNVAIPVGHASIERVSSSSSSLCCVSTHNAMSNKLNAHQNLPIIDSFQGPDHSQLLPHRRPEIFHVYTRRRRRRREEEDEKKKKQKQKRRIGNGELMKLGVDLSVSTTPRLRECRINALCSGSKQNGSSQRKEKLRPASSTAKKWVRFGFTFHCAFAGLGLRLGRLLLIGTLFVRLIFYDDGRLSHDGVDPKSFIGLQCKASVELLSYVLYLFHSKG